MARQGVITEAMTNYKAQMTKGNGFGIQAFGFQLSFGF